MKFERIEILFYVTIFLVTLIGSSIHVLSFDRPNTNPPSDPVEFPGQNVTMNEVPDVNQRETGNFLLLFKILTWIAILGVVLLFMYFMVSTFNSYSTNKLLSSSSKKQRTKREKIKKIKDAREIAYKIIKEGLSTGEYTSSYIRAYHALDESLNYFREISRPPYWTPKEYAYNVNEPIFRPSVFKFVSIFYDLRYGSLQATRENLENFKLTLDFLFINEVPKNVFEEWTRHFEKHTDELNVYHVPSRTDLTKPKGGRY